MVHATQGSDTSKEQGQPTLCYATQRNPTHHTTPNHTTPHPTQRSTIHTMHHHSIHTTPLEHNMTPYIEHNTTPYIEHSTTTYKEHSTIPHTHTTNTKQLTLHKQPPALQIGLECLQILGDFCVCLNNIFHSWPPTVSSKVMRNN